MRREEEKGREERDRQTEKRDISLSLSPSFFLSFFLCLSFDSDRGVVYERITRIALILPLCERRHHDWLPMITIVIFSFFWSDVQIVGLLGNHWWWNIEMEMLLLLFFSFLSFALCSAIVVFIIDRWDLFDRNEKKPWSSQCYLSSAIRLTKKSWMKRRDKKEGEKEIACE